MNKSLQSKNVDDVSLIRNHVYESLTSTLTRKVRDSVRKIDRYALHMEVNGEIRQVE